MIKREFRCHWCGALLESPNSVLVGGHFYDACVPCELRIMHARNP